MWCIPKLDDEYISRMEDILDLYEKPYDPTEPILCLDEKSTQLLEDTRSAIPTKAGSLRKRDYEYKRNGTKNIFMVVEPKAGFRTPRVTPRRTKADFAREIKRIANIARYKTATTIHIMLDNLNTHFEKSLIETFGEEEAARILLRIQFHYTPKHASWLNMAEIEIGVLQRQVLKKHVATVSDLRKQMRAWKTRRNSNKTTINWSFTSKKAQEKFGYEV